MIECNDVYDRCHIKDNSGMWRQRQVDAQVQAFESEHQIEGEQDAQFPYLDERGLHPVDKPVVETWFG